MTKDELIRALETERHNGLWWTSKRERDEALAIDDSDMTTAKRRRDMARDFDRSNEKRAS